MTKHGCSAHESTCTKNPQVRPLCYDCKHYHADMFNTIDVDYYYDTAYGTCVATKKFYVNKCLLSDGLLYHNIKLSDNVTTALEENYNFTAMPTRARSGCNCFEELK